MLYRITTRAALMVLMTMLAVPGAFCIEPDFAHDVSINGDASPTVSQSGVNNYVYQDEQINLEKDSGNVRVLRTDQKINLNEFITATIEIKNANVRELRDVARTICRKEGGDADIIIDNKVGGKQYMVVICPEWQLPYVVQTLRALDRKHIAQYEDGSWQFYYKAKNRSIDKLFEMSKSYSSPDTIWTFDYENNALMFWDQPNNDGVINNPAFGLPAVDIPPSQITLDVKIYEVDTQDTLDLGLDFEAWKNGPGKNLFRFIYWDFEGDLPNTVTSDLLDWGRFRSYNFLATTAWVDYCQEQGEANLLVDSPITAKSGSVASLSDSKGLVTYQRYPIPIVAPANITEHEDEADVPNPPNFQNWGARTLTYREFTDTGISLTIRPVVGLESAEVDISLLINDTVGLSPVGDPIMSRRSFHSSLEVKDGVPIVLSGFKRSTQAEGSMGIPFLSDIPYIGKILFGKSTKIKVEKELVVFLTPHFKVYSMDDPSAPVAVKTANLIADGGDVPEPKSKLGYTQWLLDPDATCPIKDLLNN